MHSNDNEKEIKFHIPVMAVIQPQVSFQSLAFVWNKEYVI